MAFRSQRRLFLFLLAFRLANSLLVQTYFNPDEYWQSLEVAHRAVFGYGYVTWEWREAVRGYLHPLLFAALFKLLAALGLASPAALRVAPRLVQGAFAAVGDLCLCNLTARLFSTRAADWALVCQLLNWFTFFCVVRPFSNCIEAVLTTAALCYWPLENEALTERLHDPKASGLSGLKEKTPLNESTFAKEHQSADDLSSNANRTLALLLAGLACILRPTSAVLWAFLGVREFWRARDRGRLMLEVLLIGSLCLGTSTLTDRQMYGRWTFVPLNFLRFNLGGGASAYGTHPWHWYFTQGLPAMATTLLPFAAFGIFHSGKRSLAGVIFWVLAAYSFLGHKEFRFILPILPLVMAYAGHALAIMEHRVEPLESTPTDTQSKPLFPSKSDSRKPQINHFEAQSESLRQRKVSTSPSESLSPAKPRSSERPSKALCASLIFLALTQVPMALYFSLIHQRGAVKVMEYLSSEAQAGRVSGVWFLMPCHSTPFYSHLHVPVPMRILDCSPSSKAGHVPEDERFFRDPLAFLNDEFKQLETGENFDGTINRWRELIGSAADGLVAGDLPSHVVMFVSVEAASQELLLAKGFVKGPRFFHSHFPVDRELQSHVVVYMRPPAF